MFTDAELQKKDENEALKFESQLKQNITKPLPVIFIFIKSQCLHMTDSTNYSLRFVN